MNEIIYMKRYLHLIRMIVGWTAKDMGEKIGATRQTINNLENTNYDEDKFKLTKTKYLAISYVLDKEINEHPDDTIMLKIFLEMVVYNHESYNEKDINKVINIASLLAPSILAKACTRKEVSDKFQELFAN